MVRDAVQEILERLERPVEPSPEFAERLLSRLLEELELGTDGEAARLPARPVRRPWPRLRLPRLAFAGAALGLVGVLVATVVVLVQPSEVSALSLVRTARTQFPATPPFQAVIVRTLTPEAVREDRREYQGGPYVTEVRVFSRSRTVWRRDILSDPNVFKLQSGLPLDGSFEVTDGKLYGFYEARARQFFVQPREEGEPFAPLTELDPLFYNWQAPGGPTLATDAFVESRCSPASDDVIAGRAASHVRCAGEGPLREVWLDEKFGLVLKLVSSVGTTEVRSIAFDPSFRSDAFEVDTPTGATMIWVSETQPAP